MEGGGEGGGGEGLHGAKEHCMLYTAAPLLTELRWYTNGQVRRRITSLNLGIQDLLRAELWLTPLKNVGRE